LKSDVRKDDSECCKNIEVAAYLIREITRNFVWRYKIVLSVSICLELENQLKNIEENRN
jgi:hypothetical protein